ncbi:hypothetical protein [Streptomyces monomycini]|uniref:hypothetical protein n=1 Tax=Streptomyces monomycini TaxID=371720 RepID=UPI000A6468C7|nr:hypothetical protein [Streptomyces monomycini]
MPAEPQLSALLKRLETALEHARELRGRKRVVAEENWRLLDENYRLRRQRSRLVGRQQARD